MLLAAIAFGPSIAAPFNADDGPAISLNASIRQLWPPSIPLSPPGAGTAVSGRPVANYSFALNYAINRAFGVAQSPENGANETISYHVVDIGLHVIAALLLFAVIWRTIRFGAVPDSWRESAERVAVIVAGLWLIHPIQTEAVDYVSQRTELLVSVWYLATMYAAIRAWWGNGESTSATTRARTRWLSLSVVACALGMATKEVMFTAPLIVLLFDRAFASASWSAIWHDRVRRVLYLALFATMGVSLALIAHGARAATVGFDLAMPWYRYLYTQAWAIARYLQLILWPDRLLYSYGRDPLQDLSGVPGAILLVGLGVATLVAWTRDRWRWAGFIGAFFFLLLAPSSSVVPIVTEIAAERRIYLASAAVILAIVVGIERAHRALIARAEPSEVRRRTTMTWLLIGVIGLVYLGICAWAAGRIASDAAVLRVAVQVAIGAVCAVAAYGLIVLPSVRARATVVAAIVCALLGATAARSAMYAEPVRLWRDVVAKRPNDAHAVIAVAEAEMRFTPPDDADADSLLRRATELDSTLVLARVYRAAIAIKQQRLADAETLLVKAVQISPLDSAATDKLGQLLLATNRERQAIPYLAKVARAFPAAETYKRLGLAYLMTGQLDSATAVLQAAFRADPSNSDVIEYLGEALIDAGRGAEALPLFNRALQSNSSAMVFAMASLADAEIKQTDAAVRAASDALARGQNDPMVMMLTGRAMDMSGRYPDAAKLFARAAQLAPNDPDVLTRLAVVQAEMGNTTAATRGLDSVLSRDPGYAPARTALSKIGGVRRGR